jgi:hypothetical protein
MSGRPFLLRIIQGGGAGLSLRFAGEEIVQAKYICRRPLAASGAQRMKMRAIIEIDTDCQPKLF